MKQVKKDLRKMKRSLGFTMTEMLAAVAILVILMGLATVGLVALRKQLRQRELDSKAEIIYVAAQNRLTELRAAGYDNVFTPGSRDGDRGIYKLQQLPSDAKESEEGQDGSDTDRPDLYSVFSEDRQDEGMAAKSMLPSTVVDIDLWDNHWIIQYDPVGGSVYGVFYSEETERITRDESKLNTLRYKQGRLADGAKVGYYGGDITRINFTSELHPSLEIINAEKLILKIRCNKAVSGMAQTGATTLCFDIRLNNGAYVKTVTESQMTQVSGTDFLYTWVMDSLLDGEHFYEQTGIPGGHTVAITVEARVEGDDYVSGQKAEGSVNSLFADVPSDAADKSDAIAYIGYGRHLQNLDSATSHVASDITKAMMVRDFSFRDDKRDSEDYYSYYGAYFKPIENSNLQSFDGCYNSTTGKMQTVIDALHIPVRNPGSGSEYTNAGLFAAFYGKNLDNIYLSGLRIDGGTTVGGIAARVSGSVTVRNCRVYLDDRNGDLSGVVRQPNPEDVPAWLTGGTVGGLVGTVPSGSALTVESSFAATVLSARRYAGGLVGTAAGSLTVNTAYADCYLRSGYNAGGILGGSTTRSTVRLKDFYAAGFAAAGTNLAGIAAGPVTSQTDGYTAVNHTRLEDTTALYSTCMSSAASSKVFYVPEERVGDVQTSAPVDLADTQGFGADQLASGSLLGENMAEGQKDHLDTSVFFSGRRQSASPYNLLQGMTLTSYPYPALQKLAHFGDWKAVQDQETLVYYEYYADDTYGVYGDLGTSLRSQDELAIGSRTALRDGYAWAVAELPSGSWERTVTYADGTTQTLLAGEAIETALNGKPLYLFRLNGSRLNSLVSGDSFYQPLKVTDTEQKTQTFYFNPGFAKTAIKSDVAPETPQSIFIRTARQLYALSRCYASADFQSDTAKSTFFQELDVDYGTYRWMESTGAAAPGSQAPIGGTLAGGRFRAVYNGGSHTVKNLNILSDSMNMGLFGAIGSTGKVRNLFLVGTGTAQTNTVLYAGESGQYFRDETSRPYIGVLAGINEGEIDNCAVTGYRLEAYGYRNATLTIGGLVGLNRGHITDSSADIREIKFSNDHSTGKIGGFVGSNEGAISTSYAAGEINVRYATDSTVTIAGFAAENSSSLYTCYAGVVLLASGDAKAYGFAPNGSGISDCFYLDGGTFNYANALRSMNTSTNIDSANAGGTPITGADLSVKRLAGFGSANTEAQTLFHPETEVKNYPYPAVTHLADGTLAHLGNWAAPEMDLGTLGLFYWEYESGGSNAGYHFSLLGTDQGLTISESTLCQAHDDGGVITRFGYGYFYAADGDVPTVDFGSDTHRGAIHEDVGQALEAQLPKYRFVAYETGAHDNGGDTYMHLSGSNVNGTWKLNYKDVAEYTYSVCPFFANSMSMDSYTLREGGLPNGTWSSLTQTNMVRPGLKETGEDRENSYEIRSVAQLQYINWNYGAMDTNYSIRQANYWQANASRYPYLTYSNPNAIPKAVKKYNWKQTHDIDSFAESGNAVAYFTPIGSMYDTRGASGSSGEPYMSYFSSAYDGRDYVIKNISIRSGNQCVGVFGLTASASMKNISLYSDQNSVIEGSTSDSWYCLGGLVGFAGSGWDTTDNIFENCTVSGYKILDTHSNDIGWGGGNVGGLVGATNMNINNCSAVTDIELKVSGKVNTGFKNIRVGGLAGICRATVTSCYAGGSIVDSSQLNMVWPVGSGGSIWVGGLVGGVIIREGGSLGQQIGRTDNQLKVYNCYSYVTMPPIGVSGRYNGLIRASIPIASHGEMMYDFAIMTNTTVEIYNSYCLTSEVTDTDGYAQFANQPDSYWQRHVNVNVQDPQHGEAGREIYVINGGRSPYLTYEQMRDGTLQYYLNNPAVSGVAGADYEEVTTEEKGNPIDGKYSFPGGDKELQNLNYPFPTILTQTDIYGNTVHVHYGRWPKFGLYWDENIDTMDLLRDWKSDTAGASLEAQDAEPASATPDEDTPTPETQAEPEEAPPAVTQAGEDTGQPVAEPTAEEAADTSQAAEEPEASPVSSVPAVQAQTGSVSKVHILNVYSLQNFNPAQNTVAFTYETDSGAALDEAQAAAIAVACTPSGSGYQVRLQAVRPGTVVVVAEVQGYKAKLTLTVTAELQLEIVGESVVSPYEEDTVELTVKLADGLHLEEPDKLTVEAGVVSRDPEKPSAIAVIDTAKDGSLILRITGKNSGSATVTVKATYSPSWAQPAIEAAKNVSVNTLPSMTLGITDGTDFTGVSVLHTPNNQKHTGQSLETGPLAEDVPLYLFLTCDKNAAADYVSLEQMELKTVTLHIGGADHVLTQSAEDESLFGDGAYTLRLGNVTDVPETQSTDAFHYRTLEVLDANGAQPRQQWNLTLSFGRQGSGDQERYELTFDRANVLTFHSGTGSDDAGQVLKTVRVSQGSAPEADQEALDRELNDLAGAEAPETGKHWSWVLPTAEEITGNMDIFRSPVSNTYTVVFDGNFDGWDIEETLTMTMAYGDEAPAPASPYTLDGYSLLGWAEEATATEPTYRVGDTLKNLTDVHGATVTLYAVWTPNRAELTLHTGVTGADGAEIVYSDTALYDQAQSGAVLTLPGCGEAREGYTFLGWAAKAGSAVAEFMPGESYRMDVNAGSRAFDLYAVWQKDETDTATVTEDALLPPESDDGGQDGASAPAEPEAGADAPEAEDTAPEAPEEAEKAE